MRCSVGWCSKNYVSALAMENIKGRNELNMAELDDLYTRLDPTKGSNAENYRQNPAQYCLDTKEVMSRSAFMAQEAYVTKGAINHVVHSGQAGAAIAWISRSEFMDSFLENLGDFQKEVAHEHPPADANQLPQHADDHLVKASKYVARLFDAHHRIKSSTTTVDASAERFATCAFPHIYHLQKQVRNKVPMSEEILTAPTLLDLTGRPVRPQLPRRERRWLVGHTRSPDPGRK